MGQQRIRKLRLERGLTQEALALEPGVTRNVPIHVEQGKRGLLFERLYDLAAVLDAPAADLLLVHEPGPKPHVKHRNPVHKNGTQGSAPARMHDSARFAGRRCLAELYEWV